MKSHGDFQNDLPAYAARRLKGEELRLLEEHLETCDDCDRIASAWSEMAAVLRDGEDVLFEPHPGETDLRQLAVGEAGAATERILRHLDVCASCELEARMWDRSGAIAGTRSAPVRRGRVFAIGLISAAAGLLLGLGIAALWQSWNGFGSRTESSWAGPTVQILLPRPLRGEPAPMVSHRIEKEEKRVVIAFPLLESNVQADDGLYQFEVVGAAGPVLTQVLTGSSALRHLQAASVITIDLSAELLPPGRYECRVIGPDGVVIYRTSMVIVPTD